MHILYNVEGSISKNAKERRFDTAIENFIMLTGLTAYFEKRENLIRCIDGECNATFERIQLWRYFLLKNYTKIPRETRMVLGSNIQLRIMQMMREFGNRGNKKVKNVLENLNYIYYQ